MRRALQELGWTGLTVLGVFIGLFIGLAVAPELPAWAPWMLGVAAVAALAMTWLLRRGRQPH